MKLVASSVAHGVVTLTVDVGGRGGALELFLVSDVHIDSAYSRRDLWQAHMEKVLQSGAAIIDGGDFFDAMQGRFDPRRSMEDLRPEYRRDDYFDYVVMDAARLLRPYAEHLVLMAQGNHELSVLKYANTSLIDRLAYELNRDRKTPPIQVGGYTGWVRIKVLTGGKPRGTLRLYYAHGAGGRAPVTRGVIATNRQAVFLPDADVVLNGHNHQAYIVPIARERLNAMGRVRGDLAWFVRTPGYKDEWAQNRNGYAAQGGGGPHPFGGVWIHGEFVGEDLVVQAETLFGV